MSNRSLKNAVISKNIICVTLKYILKGLVGAAASRISAIFSLLSHPYTFFQLK